MAIDTLTPKSIINPRSKSATNVRARTQALRQKGALGVDIADMGDQIQAQLDLHDAVLRAPLPLPDEFFIKDPMTGELIAWIGYRVVNGVVYKGGFFSQLYIGGSDPTNSPFFSDGTSVQIGKNGWISVLDPFSNIAAWIGTQSEQTLPVTGAVAATGLIRLTVTNHHFTTGDTIDVVGVGGVPNATGQWIIKVITANTFDLIGSTFAGAYTSGGTVRRYFAGAAFEQIAVGGATRITNAINNGSGLIRITSTAHGLQTGWFATVTGVGGVPNANGYFYVTRIDADTVDLQGSVFAGTYTTGGSIFSWPAAHFRAQADGSLHITNATIELVGAAGIITLDPDLPAILMQTTGLPVNIFSGLSPTLFTMAYEDNSYGIAISPLQIEVDAGGIAQAKMEAITGKITGKALDIGGVIINPLNQMSGLASVDSTLYKVGGTTGLGHAVSYVTNVTGPGVTSVTVETVTFNSGILISAV